MQQRRRGAWWLGSLLGTSLWLLCALALSAPDESRYDAVIHATAWQHGLEPSLVKAVIKCESGFNALAVSPRGAQGLMQLMPATQALLGLTDAFAPPENIAAGVRYLAMLQQLFAGNVSLMLAAYNAGPQAVLAAGSTIPEWPETQRYVQCVLAAWQRYRQPGNAAVLLPPAPRPTPQTTPSTALQVYPLRLSHTVARVGQALTVQLDAAQVGGQISHGVIMLMYPDAAVSYAMLKATDKETTVRLPGATSGLAGPAAWVANTYHILRGDWPQWRPGQRRNAAWTIVPRVAQDITMHVSIFLYNTAVNAEQQRWSTVVHLPVQTNPQ